MPIKTQREKKHTLIIFIFMVIFLVKGVFYAVYVTPLTLGTSPDDVGHFSYIQFIYSEKKLPVLHETKMEDVSLSIFRAYYEGNANTKNIVINQESFDESNDENWIVQHPPLYYLLMTPIYAICKLFSKRVIVLICTLRIATLLFGVATLFVIRKILDILKPKDAVRYCIYIAFVFSVPLQFYFTNITNDSLLIFLCTFALYFLLNYTATKIIKNYYLFVACCGLAIITKYTGGLIIIGYIAFFLYKSIREDGLKKTINLALRGIILGAAIISPVLIRNLVLYGKLFITYEANTRVYDFSLYHFIVKSGYFNELFTHLITLIGCARLITGTEISRLIIALIVAFSACIYCCNRSKKYEQYVLLFLGISILAGTQYVLKTEFSVGMVIASAFIIFISNLKSDDISIKEKEISTFFAASVIIVFAVFMSQHYMIYCHRGHTGAMHGRYYYIAIFPMLYLLFHSLEKFKHTKYVPIMLMTAMVYCEVQTVMQCILTW